MLRLTLTQMRRSAGRLAAAGVAIAIGTAFVAATLLAELFGAANLGTALTFGTIAFMIAVVALILVPRDR